MPPLSVEVKRPPSTPLLCLVLGSFYLLSGKLGLSLAFIHASASLVWPPTGLSLAAVLLFGTRVWPGIFGGAFLVNVTTAGSIGTSLGIACGNTLEAVVGGWLVQRFARGPEVFKRADSILKYVLLAALVSTAISSTLGVTSLALGGYASWSRFGSIWLTWWLGDLVSDLIIAPLLVTWKIQPFQRLSWRRTSEVILLLLVLAGIGQLVFQGGLPTQAKNYPLEFLTIPPLLWAAYRFHQRGAASAVFIISGIAIAGTLKGYGPFALPDINQSLLLLQAFMAVISVTSLLLAALVSESQLAGHMLRQSHQALEQQVRQRTASLQETSDQLEAFCYSIAHDLRGPLRAIQGFAQAIFEDYSVALDAAGKQHLHRIMTGADQLDHLIRDLLYYSRISRQELQFQSVSLKRIIDEVQTDLASEIEIKKCSLICPNHLPAAWGHELTLKLICSNLLSNALKFVHPNKPPQIRIWAEENGHRVRLWIEDNGIGIAPEYREKIFQIFQRLHSSEDYPGTGIGLAIVRKGVERLGGAVGVESTPGIGSRFWIELPRGK